MAFLRLALGWKTHWAKKRATSMDDHNRELAHLRETISHHHYWTRQTLVSVCNEGCLHIHVDINRMRMAFTRIVVISALGHGNKFFPSQSKAWPMRIWAQTATCKSNTQNNRSIYTWFYDRLLTIFSLDKAVKMCLWWTSFHQQVHLLPKLFTFP